MTPERKAELRERHSQGAGTNFADSKDRNTLEYHEISEILEALDALAAMWADLEWQAACTKAALESQERLGKRAERAEALLAKAEQALLGAPKARTEATHGCAFDFGRHLVNWGELDGWHDGPRAEALAAIAESRGEKP